MHKKQIKNFRLYGVLFFVLSLVILCCGLLFNNYAKAATAHPNSTPANDYTISFAVDSVAGGKVVLYNMDEEPVEYPIQMSEDSKYWLDDDNEIELFDGETGDLYYTKAQANKGYVFKGWDPEVPKEGSKITKNMTFTAKFTKEKPTEHHKVSFVANPSDCGRFISRPKWEYVNEIEVNDGAIWRFDEFDDEIFITDDTNQYEILPEPIEGYIFTNWDGIEPETEGTITQDTIFTANFVQTTTINKLDFAVLRESDTTYKLISASAEDLKESNFYIATMRQSIIEEYESVEATYKKLEADFNEVIGASTESRAAIYSDEWEFHKINIGDSINVSSDIGDSGNAAAGICLCNIFNDSSPKKKPFNYIGLAKQPEIGKIARNRIGVVTYPITVIDGISVDVAKPGETVVVVANEPTEGKVFDKWESDDVTFEDPTSESTTFVMPAKAVNIKATYKDAKAALNKIEVTTPPTKISYTIGDKFDKTGMVVTATYTDGTTKEISNYSCNPESFTKVGSQNVTISYTEEEVTKETTVGVTVIDRINSITIIGKYTYSGSQIKPEAKNIIVKGDSGSDVTSDMYDITYGENKFAGKDSGSVTVTGKEGKIEGSATGTFTIDKLSITIPAADTTKFTYTGAPQTYKLATSVYYDVQNNTQTNAGEYTVSARLKDNTNTIWADDTTADQIYNFVINQAEQTIATPQPKSYAYDYIEIKDIDAGFGETQYAISTTKIAPETGWQTPTKFDGLKDNTTYYIYAKYTGDDNHKAAISQACTVTTMSYEQAFEDYKRDRYDSLDYLWEEGDSKTVDEIISAARTDLLDMEYDPKQTPEQNVQRIDDRYEKASTDIVNQRPIDFANFKESQIQAVKGKLQDGDSENVQPLIDTTVEIINAISFDPNKTPKANMDIVNEETASLDYAIMSDRVENFNNIKNQCSIIVEELTDIQDTEEIKEVIDAAMAYINTATYDESITPSENKVVIETTVSELQDNLATLRLHEFEKMKANTIAELNAMLRKSDSKTIQQLVSDAIANIEKISYDKTINLSQNESPIIELAIQAESEITNHQAAEDVIALIKSIPTPVTVNDEAAVIAARQAYEALTQEQKELVGIDNVKILEQKENELADAKHKKDEPKKKESDVIPASDSTSTNGSDYTSSSAQTNDINALIISSLIFCLICASACFALKRREF